MGRSFAISCALVALAGCWDQAQIQLDVTRDNTSDDVDIMVCDMLGSQCDPMNMQLLFGQSNTALQHRVSIFSSSPEVRLHLSPITGSEVCVAMTISSHLLERDVAVTDSGLTWCVTTPNCEPTSTCP